MTLHVTNRAIYVVNPTMWNAPADIGVGLLAGASAPAALTQAAIYDLDTVDDLLALTGVAEPTDASYSRVMIDLGTAVEDDTNDRVNYPADDADFGALDNEQIYAGFYFVDGADDTARVLLGVDILPSAVTTNGAGSVWRTGGVAGVADVLRFQHA